MRSSRVDAEVTRETLFCRSRDLTPWPAPGARVAEYVDSPRMVRRVASGGAVSVVVHGMSGSYAVTAAVDADGPSSCTCPADARPCKHIEALRRTYLLRPQSFLDVDEAIGELRVWSHDDLLRLVDALLRIAPEAYATARPALAARSPLRPLVVDVEEIAWAMENQGTEDELDLATGEIVVDSSDDFGSLDDEEGSEIEALDRDDEDDDAPSTLPRRVTIPKLASDEAWEDRREFAESVEDPVARDKLLKALARRKPFGDALAEFGPVRDAWFEWHDARMVRRIAEWLAGVGIVAVPERRGGTPP